MLEKGDGNAKIWGKKHPICSVVFMLAWGVFWFTWKNKLMHKLGDENAFDDYVVT